MEALVKLSFYMFAASSVAVGAASLSYIAYTIGRVRVRRATMATSAGTTVTSSTAENMARRRAQVAAAEIRLSMNTAIAAAAA